MTLNTSKRLQGPMLRFLTFAIVAAATSSCTLGPDFHRPAAPASAYAQPPATVGSQSLQYGGDGAADGSTLFGSDAVNSLVQDALTNNPDLEAARHNLRAAQYELQAVAGTAL